jgi:cholesterol transport system auxiliary component
MKGRMRQGSVRGRLIVGRRGFGLCMPFVLAACGLAERPYAERRQWPLTVARPGILPPRPGGLVLEVRGVRPGPGLDERGLQTLQSDGSVQISFYEQWAVAPAQGVEEALRRWLAQSGKFAAVIDPGSRVNADISLDGELTALLTDRAAGIAHAGIAVTVIDLRTSARRILLQRTLSGAVAAADGSPQSAVEAQRSALAVAFAGIEGALPVR